MLKTGSNSTYKYKIINKANEQLYFTYSFIFLVCLTILFSPLVSYVLSLIIIWLYGPNIKRREMYFFVLLFCISFSLIVSSKAFDVSEADDFLNYFNDYYQITINTQNFSQVLSQYSFGLELGLPLIFMVIGILLPILTPHQLMFLLAFLFSMIFSTWLVNTCYVRHYKTLNHGYIIALALILLSLTSGSQLVRQGISSAILLFAISNRDLVLRSTFLFIASIFHLTAIPIFLISIILLKYKWKGFTFLLSVLGIFFLIGFDSLTEFPELIKIAYYSKLENAEISSVDIGTLKWLTVAVIIGVFSAITKKTTDCRISNEVATWTPFTLFFIILFISFIQYPLISTRLTMIFSSLILGYLLSIFVLNSKFSLLRPVALVVMLGLKLFTLLQFSEKGSGSYYWNEYDWIGLFPGYYLIK